MIISHHDNSPSIHKDAWVAPDATICGNVKIGAHSRILWGARIIAEDGEITIGQHNIIMENAVLRSSIKHPLNIGNHCLIGPNTHVVGCTIEDEAFIATGAAIFHGAVIGKGAEIRVNGIVHLRSHLQAGETVPINWVAVGNPAEIFPPDQHDKIWSIQKPLNFPQYVYDLDRNEEQLMKKVTEGISNRLITHKHDQILKES